LVSSLAGNAVPYVPFTSTSTHIHLWMASAEALTNSATTERTPVTDPLPICLGGDTDHYASCLANDAGLVVRVVVRAVCHAVDRDWLVTTVHARG
jgi:hypothetical protein